MRAPGTGTIHKLPSGRYRPQLPGRRGRKLPSEPTYEAAERALTIALHLIQQEGLRTIEPGTTLGPYGRRVLQARDTHGYRNAREELKRWTARVEPSELGRRAVESITRADVVAFVRALAQSHTKRGGGHRTHKSRRVSRSLVVDVLRILRVVFREACDVDKLRQDDPTAGVEVPPGDDATHDPWTWLRPGEVVRLLEVAGSATVERDLGGLPRAGGERGRAVVPLVPPDDYDALLVALYTGLREGELWQLHLRDVDLPAGRITVRYGSRRGTKLLAPKGRRGRVRVRVLQLLPPALAALERQLERLTTPVAAPVLPRTPCALCRRRWATHEGGEAEGCPFESPRPAAPRPNPHGLVFPSSAPQHRGAYRAARAPRWWGELVERAGLGTADRGEAVPVVWHSLRHTFATLVLAGRLPGCEGEGWRIERVSAYLGHTSIAVTQRYADVAALL